jgi:hypothetical protein
VTKTRVSIPADIIADVIFASDATCCVCRERGKAVQVHHVDEDPANNVFENLAVLCLACHNDTQLTGGFGRKINATLVVKYRDEWLGRVTQRRDAADLSAVNKMVGSVVASPTVSAAGISVETLPYSKDRANVIFA